jgi:GAF domain-containing protein
MPEDFVENSDQTQSMLEQLKEIKRSVFRILMVAMIGFGGIVGLVFPLIAKIFLPTQVALTVQFLVFYGFAGLLIGFVNYIIFRAVISNEISHILQEMNKVFGFLQSPKDQRESQDYQIPITSSDAIGKIQIAFNQLVNILMHHTRALEASAQVSSRLSTITDLNTLFEAVVEEIQSTFHFYHAQIYLFDEKHEKLVMKHGTGNAGKVMLERNHTLSKGMGLVGRSANEKQVILVQDTSLDPSWLPNPLLPDTQSEVAIPIADLEQVLGVLDIQQSTKNGISINDVDLLQSIANQVAVAIKSKNALTETDALLSITADLNAAHEFQDVLFAITTRTILKDANQSLMMCLFDKPFMQDQIPEWIYPVAYKADLPVEIAERYPISAFEVNPNTIFKSQIVIINDVAMDNRLDRITRKLFQDVFHSNSSIIVPLNLSDQNLGFVMANFDRIVEFSEVEIQRLNAIAGQAAITVQSLQLLKQTQARVKREQLLREVTEQINNATSTDMVLYRAALELGRVMKHQVFVYLGKDLES